MSDKKNLIDKINEYVDNFAEKGYRALGVAKTDESGNWQLCRYFWAL